MVDYTEFVEFHKKHPDLDNQEYYAEFPDTNKSTIRSWKGKVRKPKVEAEIPLPSKAEAADAKGFEEELIDTLSFITKTPKEHLIGLGTAASIQFLRNKRDAEANQEPEEKSRGSNTPILPIPKPIGQNKAVFGIDKFIVFDKNKNEIRMEIPMDVLFDPDKNKGLGEITKG